MDRWFTDAKPVPLLEAEICFLLQPSFYYGPDTAAEIEERKLADPLPVPNIVRAVNSMVRSSEAIGNETELARYYRAVISAARKHRKQFDAYRQYFWIRFWLWNPVHDVHISFPWYDTLGEVDTLVAKLASAEDGELFWDRDQGWRLDIHGHRGDLYIREMDPDAGDTRYVVKVPRAVLIDQANAACSRARGVVKVLTDLVGADLWSSRQDHPEFLSETTPGRPWWRLW